MVEHVPEKSEFRVNAFERKWNKLAKNEEPIFCGSFLLYPKIVIREPIPLLLYYVSFDGWRNFLRKVIKSSTHNTFIFFWHNLLFCNWLIYFFEIKFSYTIAIFFWKIVLSENLVSFKKCNGEKAVCFLKIYILYSGIPVLSGSSRSTFHTELELQGGILLPGYILFWIMHPSTT